MPGFSDQFPWPSYYGNYDYFENRMARHQKVAELTAEGDGVYRLRRTRGDVLRLFICECYAFGVADYIETTGKLGHLDLVIINSAWCGYACKTPALRPAPPACCANDQIGGKLFGPSCERRDDHQFASAPRVPTTIYRPASSRAAAAGGAIQPAVCVRQIEILPSIRNLQDDPETVVSRSEEHTSELQSLMRISYSVFC